MYGRADTNDAFPRIFRFAIPDPPTQSLDFGDDHSLRRYSRQIAGRQCAGDLLKMFKPHSDMKPVENWRFGDSGIGENASESRTSIGEDRQFGAFRSADGVKVPADQCLGVRIGFRDGIENLSCTGFGFDVANPHLQMTLPVLTTPDEGGIQGDRHRRRRCFRPDRGTIRDPFAYPQGMAAQRLRVRFGSIGNICSGRSVATR
jgi:hypothetical protein